MKRQTFVIDTHGNVTVKDVCGMGMSCQQATADIEKLLGTVDENSRGLTENYYQEVDPLVLKQEA